MFEQVATILKTSKDWGRLRTTIPGIFVLKLPTYKRSPNRLVIKLNPVDEAWKPKKRRGLRLRTSVELEEFMTVFQNEKRSKLFNMINKVNPKIEPRSKGEVLEL